MNMAAQQHQQYQQGQQQAHYQQCPLSDQPQRIHHHIHQQQQQQQFRRPASADNTNKPRVVRRPGEEMPNLPLHGNIAGGSSAPRHSPLERRSVAVAPAPSCAPVPAHQRPQPPRRPDPSVNIGPENTNSTIFVDERDRRLANGRPSHTMPPPLDNRNTEERSPNCAAHTPLNSAQVAALPVYSKPHIRPPPPRRGQQSPRKFCPPPRMNNVGATNPTDGGRIEANFHPRTMLNAKVDSFNVNMPLGPYQSQGHRSQPHNQGQFHLGRSEPSVTKNPLTTPLHKRTTLPNNNTPNSATSTEGKIRHAPEEFIRRALLLDNIDLPLAKEPLAVGTNSPRTTSRSQHANFTQQSLGAPSQGISTLQASSTSQGLLGKSEPSLKSRPVITINTSPRVERRVYTPEEFERAQLYPPPPPPKRTEGYVLQQHQHQRVLSQEGQSLHQSASFKPPPPPAGRRNYGLLNARVMAVPTKGVDAKPSSSTVHGKRGSHGSITQVSSSTYGESNISLHSGESLAAHIAALESGKCSSQDGIKPQQLENNNSQGSSKFDAVAIARAILEKTNRPGNVAVATLNKELQSQHPQEPASYLSQTRRQLSQAQEGANPGINETVPKVRESAVGFPGGENVQEDIEQRQGFRPDYALGDTARCASHMITENGPQKLTERVNSLEKHDFAWIKRSDGSFSYAILAYRSSSAEEYSSGNNNRGSSNNNELRDSSLSKSSSNNEECMTFVLSNVGCTKTIKKSQYSKFVHLVSSSTNETEITSSLHATPPATTTTRLQECKSSEIDQEVKSNHDVEEYLKKIRQEFYSTRSATVGEGWVPPTTISFDDAAVDDDLISCMSVPVDLVDGVLEQATAHLDQAGMAANGCSKYLPSQPVILE